jgi:stalled ribosome rescue protein Dom34
MEDTWTYIRPPRPHSEEANWYVTFFGTKKTEDLIKKIEKKRQQLGKKNEKEKQDFINSVYNEIKHNDINIIASYSQLLSSNYKYIHKKYRLIVNPLLEACYPHFIRTLHKKNEI